MKLCDKIRIIRKARGFSQEGLGDSLSRVSKDGISRQSISNWENGKSEPKLDNIRDLASVLNVSFDTLLDESINLDDQAVLASVLKSLTPELKRTVNSKFRYSLYVSTLSVKSFKNTIISGSALLFTALFLVLLILFWNTIFAIFLVLCGILFFAFVPLAIIELIRICKGKERISIGELNNTHLILHSNKEAHNTLYIPIEQITKIELGEKQKKKSGDVLIWIKGRSRAITVSGLQKPQTLIEIFGRTSRLSDEDLIEIV